MLKRLLLTLLQLLVKQDKPEKEERPPVSNKTTDWAHLMGVLTLAAGGGQVFLSDYTMTLASWDDIAWFLANDETNKATYVTEEYDCDNFSYRLMGQFSVPEWAKLAFGIVWTDVHAINCFIDEDENFWFVEPQTDEVCKELTPYMGTKIRFIMM